MSIFKKGNTGEGYFADLANNLKFRHLGLGFLWAWIYATWFTPVVFPDSGGLTVQNDISWLLSLAAVAIALLALPFILKDKDISSIRGVYLLAGPATTIGSIMMAAEPLFGISNVAISLIGAVMTGLTSALLWMLWGEFTGKVEQEFAELFVPWCVAIPLVVVFSCTFITGPIAGFAICCLPTISSILLYLSFNDTNVLKPVELLLPQERPNYLGDFIRVGIGSTAIYMCVSFAWGSMDYATMTGWGDTHLIAYVLGAAISIVVAIIAINYSTSFDIFMLYRWLIPVVLFGLVFLSIGSFATRFLSLTLITIAQFGFDIIIWIYFSRIARKGICTASYSLGINRGFVQVGDLLGSLLAMALPQFIQRGLFTFPLVILILSAIMTTVALMVLNQKDHLNRTAIKETGLPSGAEQGIAHYDEACDKLSAAHSLTARERSVLGYLARGRSIPYIREELVLSKNTVDTHVKNLYRKLDVHTRQELIDVVESFL